MFPSLDIPHTYRAALAQRRAENDAIFATGQYSRCIFPHTFMPFFLIWLALFIKYPSPRIGRLARTAFYGLICYMSIKDILYVRMVNIGQGYMAGLVPFWAVIWGGVLLVFNDAARDFARIEYSEVPVSNSDQQGIKTRRQYRWQHIPDALFHRGWWCFDLLLSLRGPNWNWRPAALPPLPQYVLDDLEPKKSDAPRAERPHPCGHKLLNDAVCSFIKGCFVIDMVKTASMQDRFFLGDLTAPYPAAFEALGGWAAPILGRTFRLFITCMAILLALKSGFNLSKIFFTSIALRFPGWAAVPLDEEWMYPPFTGPLITSAANYGIPGLWGKWWHQLFRMALTSPSDWAFNKLGRSPMKATLKVINAFTISGALHAMGSYTMLGPTRPFWGTFMFFFIQAPAIILQTTISKMLLPKLPVTIPAWVRKAGNLTVVAVWLYYVSLNFAAELATGGLWYIEPVPFSVLRAMGFGDGQAESWWRWGEVDVFRWHKGEHWWDRGIVLL